MLLAVQFLAAENCGFHYTVHEIKTSLHLSEQISSPFFLPPSLKELYAEQWNTCIKIPLPSYFSSVDLITTAMKNSIKHSLTSVCGQPIKWETKLCICGRWKKPHKYEGCMYDNCVNSHPIPAKLKFHIYVLQKIWKYIWLDNKK